MMGRAVELNDDQLQKVYDLMNKMTKYTYVAPRGKDQSGSWHGAHRSK